MNNEQAHAGQTDATQDPSLLRVLVASALADVVMPFLAQRYQTVAAVGTKSELDSALVSSLVFDVAVVDLLWNSFDSEWTFDGLDVLDRLASTRRAATVLGAIHGHSAERDYLDEAIDHPLIYGIMIKSDGPEAFTTAIETLATGGRYYSDGLPENLSDSNRPTIARWFGERELAVHIAGAIASGRASSWPDIAKLSSFQRTTIDGAPALFGNALCSFGEVAAPEEVNQPMIFRWAGEHAHYIVSWCRRNQLNQYTRRQVGYPQ